MFIKQHGLGCKSSGAEHTAEVKFLNPDFHPYVGLFAMLSIDNISTKKLPIKIDKMN